MTRIVCQQLAPRIADLAANRALALTAIREAVDAGADVVVLPELVTSGYVFASREEAATVAIAPDDAILTEWATEAARGDAIVVGGFCEQGADGNLYNSSAIVDPTGVRAVYRKLHLWDREKLVFTHGEQAPPVVETRVGRIATVVCYDLEFPELTRAVALAGAQLLAVPTNWPLGPRPDGERPPEAIVAMASARINRMAIACADRTGTERGVHWTSGTTIVDTDGWVQAESREPGAVSADVDLAPALHKAHTDRADLFADRRPEHYGAVVAALAGPEQQR
jgi:predicted amidohydrolase